ncbi:MAG TPA: hypothetical protein VHI54_03050 [Actinomycetota bacterium]|nr:hypothetical protein [Actinomycetota bacterium]
MARHNGEVPAEAVTDEGTEPARPAFYALRAGGWRDYVTLLHVPYTLWHLSYVVFGAAVAPLMDGRRLAATLVGFLLGVGLTAHALDELNGRPLQTKISERTLWTIAIVALVAAVALGVVGAIEVSWWLLAFVAFGGFIVVAYNLELFGGRFHSDLWFALSWGAFPALTAYFSQTATIRAEAVFVSVACLFLTAAQRRLSTPVRELRRKVVSVEGRLVLRDGTEVLVSDTSLRMAPEGALRALSMALPLLAVGLAVARF